MNDHRQPEPRDIIRPEFGQSDAPPGNRWAIIVGISNYRAPALNLGYARRDAEAVYDLIRQPSAGAFETDRIVHLLDSEATTANLTRALRTFLKKPARNDLVMLYLACHGAPDPERPDNVYLLTHDTDPSDIAGTALPMREIDISLRENLHAEKVIIIADTCHSAAIGGTVGRRSTVNATAAVNQYLQDLSRARAGLALITSAEANETALEGPKWGGGHGVFTHFLLEGMKGAADFRPTNGTVTVGELFEYVRTQVMEATDYQQHPTIGTNPFDRGLPVAIVDVDAAQSDGPIDVSPAPRAETDLTHVLQLERSVQLSGGISDVAISPDKRLLAAAGADGVVRVLCAQTGALLRTYSGHDSGVSAVAFHPQRLMIASSGTDRRVRLWSLLDPRDSVELETPAGSVLALAFHPTGRVLASAGYGARIMIWDTVDANPRLSFDCPERRVNSVLFTGDGARLVTGGHNGTLRFFDWQSGEQLGQQRVHRHAMLALAADRATGRLASGGRDPVIRVIEDGDRVRGFSRGHSHPVRGLAFVGDNVLLSVSSDDTIRWWDCAAGTPSGAGQADQGEVLAMAVAGNSIATIGSDCTLKLWRLVRAQAESRQREHVPTRPALTIRAGEGPLQERAGRLLRGRTFASLMEQLGESSDYNRIAIARQLAILLRTGRPLKTADVRIGELLETMIARIESLINRQLSLVMTRPEYTALEGTWRGVHHLVSRLPDDGSIKVRLLHAPKRELRREMLKAPYPDFSSLFRMIHDWEYDVLGSEPFGLIIADYMFAGSAQDVELIESLSIVAAASNAVVIAGAAPQMFRVRRYTDLGQLRDVGRLFESARYARWNSFRDKLDASYVGLVLPRVALHTVLPLFPGRPQGGEVATDATDDHVVWGNGAFAVGSALIDCFRFNGWFADLLEGTADSAIRGLAKLEAVDEFGGALQSSLEVNVPRRHRLQLADQGFIALWQRPHADECTLPDLVSCRRIGSPTSAPRSLPSADEAPSSDDDLRQKLALSRLISHIKAIGRVKRPGELEEYLQNWRRSLIKPDGVSDVGGMIQPFEDLHLEFRHEFGRIRVVPHVIHRVAPRARADRP